MSVPNVGRPDSRGAVLAESLAEAVIARLLTHETQARTLQRKLLPFLRDCGAKQIPSLPRKSVRAQQSADKQGVRAARSLAYSRVHHQRVSPAPYVGV